VPTYDFKCPKCGIETFTESSIYEEYSTPKCTDCGLLMERRFGSTAVIFKGSGFYSTENRS